MKIEKITRRIKIGCIDIFGGYDKKQAEQLNILATALHKEIKKECILARIEESEKCRLAILKSWGMNYCEKEITQLKQRLE